MGTSRFAYAAATDIAHFTANEGVCACLFMVFVALITAEVLCVKPIEIHFPVSVREVPIVSQICDGSSQRRTMGSSPLPCVGALGQNHCS